MHRDSVTKLNKIINNNLLTSQTLKYNKIFNRYTSILAKVKKAIEQITQQ